MRRERGAAAPADRQRARLRDLHDDERGRDRLVEPGRRADVRLHAPTRSSASDVGMLFTPEDRAAGVPERELERGRRRTGAPPTSDVTCRKDGTRFYCSGVTTRLGESGSGSPRSRATCRRSSRRPMRCGSPTPSFEQRVRQRTGELQAEVDEHAPPRSNTSPAAAALVTAQEDERARIARDLHDQLGQQLTALRLTPGAAQERLAAGDGDDEHRRAGARRADRQRRGLSRLGAASGGARRSRAGRGPAAIRPRVVGALRHPRRVPRSASCGRASSRATPRSRSTASPRKRSTTCSSTRTPAGST